MIGFSRPYFLVLILFLIFFLKRFSFKKTLLRNLQLILLILSLSGLQFFTPYSQINTIFLLDQSLSISSKEKEEAIQFINSSLKFKKPQDRVGIISFAGDINIEEDLKEKVNTDKISGIEIPHFTNIESAISSALSLKEKTEPLRVVLISDLQENVGNTEKILDKLKEEKVQIDIYPLKVKGFDEIALMKIQAPNIVHQGQYFSLEVYIKSYGIKEGTLEVNWEDKVYKYLLGNLHEDNFYSFSLKANKPGLNSINIKISAPKDTYIENNKGTNFIYVQGKPKILYLIGEDFQPIFGYSLKAQGWDINYENYPYSSLENKLSEYQVLILDNIPIRNLSWSKINSIKNFVLERGGTLLILGGDKSLSAGDYQQTPIEDILPLTLRPEQLLKRSNVSLVLVIDASGSMGALSGGEPKIELAKESAHLVVDFLNDEDYFGLIAFDHAYQWIVPLQPLKDKEKVSELISRIEAGGGTSLYPPLKAAGEELVKLPFKNKHIIAITDGQTEGGDFYGITKWLSKNRITISTIGIGEDANYSLLKDIAQWGNGRYYHTWDLRTLPQLLLSETKALLRPNIIEKQFVPKVEREEFLEIKEFPSLSGYVLTSSKYPYPVLLSSPMGDPILAFGQFGLGQVYVFTSALKSYWGENWLKWSDLGKFWSELLRRSIPHFIPYIQVNITQKESEGIINLRSADSYGNYKNFLNIKYLITDPMGREYKGELEQKGPGFYQGKFPIRILGKYQITLWEEEKNIAKLSWFSQNTPEFLPQTFNEKLAYLLTSSTNGKILKEPKEVFRAWGFLSTKTKDLDVPILLIIIILFLIEIILRRWKNIRELISNYLSFLKTSKETQDWYESIEEKIIN
ncbi:MAG: VWA domain-containing protein, partial [Dictyoglomaceae bacterium]|nr:VWA domain-containing protein [Dictyoglomaceae bacterium]